MLDDVMTFSYAVPWTSPLQRTLGNEESFVKNMNTEEFLSTMPCPNT